MNVYYDVEDNCYRTYPDGDIATIGQMRELIENKNLSIVKSQQENKQLKEELEEYKNPIKYFKYANKNVTEENKQLKNLIDTILNFSFFKEECPLNFEFENNTNEDKSQSIFYEDEWCENNCNDNYKDCWLKYFKKLQELEKGSDSK